MTETSPPALVWFRRGLRVDDNRALRTALESAPAVVPVFVLDDALLTRDDVAPARVRFLFQGLRALDAALRERGGRLVVRRGDPAAELVRLARETGARLLVHGAETEPWGRERDRRVAQALEAEGVAVRVVADHLLVEPDRIRTGKGTPYTVFTPFRNAWLRVPVDAPADAPTRVPVPSGVGSEAVPPLPDGPECAVAAGEEAGMARFRAFLERGILRYGEARDFPAVDGVSALSAHLKFGMVSPRRMLSEARSVRASAPPDAWPEIDTFVSQLAWRDFYHHILFHFPRVVDHSFQPAFDALAWENDPRLFDAWREGRTGYPFVDAAMRQLLQSGHMHNRARMVVASFLTKDLLIDWRWGERHFLRHLIDGDQAANNGGWQWAASTGTDAQPWFRIFNPVAQGAKFDPYGEYVRRWVPELKGVPAKAIHQPWTLSEPEQALVGCRIGRDYPRPVVDHAVRRERALALFRAAAGREEKA